MYHGINLIESFLIRNLGMIKHKIGAYQESRPITLTLTLQAVLYRNDNNSNQIFTNIIILEWYTNQRATSHSSHMHDSYDKLMIKPKNVPACK